MPIDKTLELPLEILTKPRGETLAQICAQQEKNRAIYWDVFDHFIDIRLGWRASTMRHLFHILPGQTILEIGAGDGRFTQALWKATRGECPLAAVVFSEKFEEAFKIKSFHSAIKVVYLNEFPGIIKNQKFDYVIAHHMLEDKSRNHFLSTLKNLIKPGGGILLFEPNPWNPYLRIRRLLRQGIPIKWRRPSEPISLNRLEVFVLLSQIGYTHINALPYDFLYAPIPKSLQWPAQHLSLIMENCPLIRNFAGSLCIWARNAEEENYQKKIFDLSEHQQFFNKVSFVIPCHNEEMNIIPLIEGLKDFYEKYIYEIIIVDDNSKDHTAEIAASLSLQDHRIHLLKRSGLNGVGRALKDGIAHAQGEYILIMDADFQEVIPEMRDLFDAMKEGADVAIGSRFSRESVLLNYPFTKIIANRAFHTLANFLLRKNVRDISNNLKIIKKEIARKFTIEFPDFAANAETGLKPLLMGYKIKEVPISWMNRTFNMGLSSFKLMKTGTNYARLLMRLFLRKVFK